MTFSLLWFSLGELMFKSILQVFSSFKDSFSFRGCHVFKIGKKPLFILDKYHNIKRRREHDFRFEFQDSYHSGKEAILTSTDDTYDFILKKDEFKFQVRSELIPFADDQFPYCIYFNEDKKLENIIYFSDMSMGFHIRKDITRPIMMSFYPNGKIKDETYIDIDYSLPNQLVDYTKIRGWLLPACVSYDKYGAIDKEKSYYRIFEKNGEHLISLNFYDYEKILSTLNIKSDNLTEKDKLKLEIYFYFNTYKTSISDIIQHVEDLCTISDDELDIIAMILK